MPIFQRVAVVFLLLVLVNPVAALGREATSHATDDADFCAPQNLQVEYQSNPLGVEPATSPRFSFQLCSGKRAVSQTAYRITVQQVHPAGEVSTVWDSGQVSSNTSTNIAYPTTGATPLEPDADYTWNVTVWSASSGASPSSLPATFSTGVTYPVDWHNATWIGHPNNTNTTHVYLRNTFSVPAGRQVVRAMAHVVGLGYYKLHIDGTQVSTHELGAFTTYEKRVLYDTYDCLQALRVGANPAHTVAIELGPGWYSEKSVAVGTPTLLLHLSVTFDDGTTDHVVSSPGNGWEAAAGPVVAAEMFVFRRNLAATCDCISNALIISPCCTQNTTTNNTGTLVKRTMLVLKLPGGRVELGPARPRGYMLQQPLHHLIQCLYPATQSCRLLECALTTCDVCLFGSVLRVGFRRI